MTDQPSGKLYSTVTQYWPRIAAGFIATLGVVELVLGGLTSDSGMELYLTVWAAVTGGVWFFFEKAERALGEESREKVVQWVTSTDLTAGIESIPEQFRSVFDATFGERQLSLKCLWRSGLASMGAVVVVLMFWALWLSTYEYDLYLGSGELPVELTHRLDWERVRPWLETALIQVGTWALLLNFIPDFLSLWETRVVTRWVAEQKGSLGRLLFFDFAMTTLISGVAVIGTLSVATWAPIEGGDETRAEAIARLTRFVVALEPVGLDAEWDLPTVVEARRPADLMFDDADVQTWRDEWEARWGAGELPFYTLWPNRFADGLYERAQKGEFDRVESTYGIPLGIFFYSAFATSVWLWLHAAAVLLSRFLLRMNSGVGFLLRATDVEKQPFRSMGFVSVILVSCLFALGLPLVLL